MEACFLVSVDSYMNELAGNARGHGLGSPASTEENVDGEITGNLGETLIRLHQPFSCPQALAARGLAVRENLSSRDLRGESLLRELVRP
ncbi:unnamed protein product [Spirodela intermedia]|uniref:Uncharacterized protein n=1 Tax=Spirodela intermedia TaxID=51605 RepID=A0A7I8KPG3_SPIIN|nr:unnamed protein product [Spirodela intermedia]